MEILSQNPLDTQKIVNKFVEKLRKKPRAILIGLKGDLGAGKTTFVKFAAASLGIKKHITSPTFVILKTYKLKNSNFKNFIHIDAYRLNGGRELKHLGWDNIIEDPGNIIFLEWPEKVKEILPKDTIFVHLATGEKENNERIIKFL